MPTSAAQKSQLRRDTGTDATSLPDAAIDALFDEAAETYTALAVQTAYTRVLALRGLLASAAKLTDYTANESQESLSDVFKHLSELLDYWEGKLATAIAEAESAERLAGQVSLRLPTYSTW